MYAVQSAIATMQDGDAKQAVLLDQGHERDLSRLNPQVALAMAAMMIDRAARSAPVDQPSLLTARALLNRVEAVRPSSAATQILRCRAVLIAKGRLTPEAMGYLRASYRYAPFLRGEGAWRVAVAVAYWPSLDESLRAAAVDEAVWMGEIDGNLRSTVKAIVADSPAAVRVQLRLARFDRAILR
jgi:hypothetical protein